MTDCKRSVRININDIFTWGDDYMVSKFSPSEDRKAQGELCEENLHQLIRFIKDPCVTDVSKVFMLNEFRRCDKFYTTFGQLRRMAVNDAAENNFFGNEYISDKKATESMEKYSNALVDNYETYKDNYMKTGCLMGISGGLSAFSICRWTSISKKWTVFFSMIGLIAGGACHPMPWEYQSLGL